MEGFVNEYSWDVGYRIKNIQMKNKNNFFDCKVNT